MPCYYPMIRAEDQTKFVKAADGHQYHPAKIITPDDRGELERIQDNFHYKYDLIPCGKCIGCRLEYSRQWANRGYLEAKSWENNYFVTITYDDENIEIPEFMEDEDGITYVNGECPEEWTGTLVPKEFTQFIKNVRQIMKREYNEDGIRFMACGEYGSETERPHYHIIFFNLNLPTETFYNPRIINNEVYYQNTVIERAWNKGISNISTASWNTIAYTARYITKKVNGKMAKGYYESKGKVKEFFRVSRMPGIGEGYYKTHKWEIYERDEIIIKNKAGTVSSKPPKFYDKLFEKDHPEEWEKIKRKRKKAGEDLNWIRDRQTSMFRSERLQIEARQKEEQTQKLIRLFESSS